MSSKGSDDDAPPPVREEEKDKLKEPADDAVENGKNPARDDNSADDDDENEKNAGGKDKKKVLASVFGGEITSDEDEPSESEKSESSNESDFDSAKKKKKGKGKGKKKEGKKREIKKRKGVDEKAQGKKTKKAKRVESDGSQADEENAAEEADPNKLPSFDEIMKIHKSGRSRKKERSEEELKKLEEDVERFIKKMEDAQRADRAANEAKPPQPAIYKVKMIDEVVHQLTKSDEQVQDMLLKQGVLAWLRLWLDPLPDGSPPSLTVRTKVYQCLDKMTWIERHHLGESGIGKRINERSRSSDEPDSNRALLKRLLEKWMRKVMNVADNYRDMHQRNDEYEEDLPPRVAKPKPEIDLTKPVGPKPGEKGFRLRASIPEKDNINFKRMPQSEISEEKAERIRSAAIGGKNAELENKLNNMRKTKNVVRSAGKVSIEGRGM